MVCSCDVPESNLHASTFVLGEIAGYCDCLYRVIRAKNRMYCCSVRPVARLLTNGPAR